MVRLMEPGSYEFLDHVSELRLRLRASSFGDLCVEGGRALGSVLTEGTETTPVADRRDLALRARDGAALLVDWLNELLYLADVERWVATDFEVVEASESVLRVRCTGVRVSRSPSRIKAATFHGLEIARRGGRVEADVVLDV